MNADIHIYSVNYHQTDSVDRLRSYVLKKSLFGRLGTPVTKQRPWVRIPLKPEWIIFNIWLIGACRSTNGFSVLTILFIRPYPLGACKRYLHELNLEQKKITQQLKKIEKETNISLTLRTWRWFSVVISVAMRFFRNATRGASNKKQASWKHTSNNQFWVLGLERARPKRCLRDGDVWRKNVLKDDVQSSWNKTC